MAKQREPSGPDDRKSARRPRETAIEYSPPSGVPQRIPPQRTPPQQQPARGTPPPSRALAGAQPLPAPLPRSAVGQRPQRPPWYHRRGYHVAMAIGGGLLVLLWLAPVIVAHTGILNKLVAQSVADLQIQGTVTVRSATLSWFLPVQLSGVEVRDANRQVVAVIPQLSGSRSLLGLLIGGNSPDTVRIVQPQLTLRVDDHGSNIQELLARRLARPERPALALEIVDGQMTVVDRARDATLCTIDKLQATIASRPGPRTLDVAATGTVARAGERSGRLKLALKLGFPPTPLAGRPEGGRQQAARGAVLPDTGHATLDVESLPLGWAQPVAARLAGITELGGQVSGTCQLDWHGPESDQAKLAARLVVDELTLGGPPLNGDVIRLAHLQGSSTLGGRLNDLRIDTLSADCELGKVSVACTLPLASLSAGDSPSGAGPLGSALRGQAAEMTADLDLARLAQMLPRCLHIRRDMQIVSGRVQMSLSDRPAPDGAVVQGKIEVAQLKAVQAGREIAWPQPVTVALTARETSRGPVIDVLQCQSSFLQVEGSGTLEKLTAKVHCDLDQLTAELTRFVDLGGLSLSGVASAGLVYQQQAGSNGFDAQAQLSTQKLRVALPGRSLWGESDISAKLALTGAGGWSAPDRVDTAVLHVENGDDRLEARLVQPAVAVRDGGTRSIAAWGPWDIHYQGNLENWPARLQPWIDCGDWHCGGKGELTGQLTLGQSSIQVRDLKLAVAPLTLTGPNVHLNEPTAELAFTGRWDRGGTDVQIQQASAAVTGLALRLSDSRLSLAPRSDVSNKGQVGSIDLSGSVQYDLDKLSEWARSYTGDEVRLSGQGSGPISIRGPLPLDRTDARAAFQWQQADVYGFHVGPGQIKARLAGGMLQIEPLALDVNQGRVELAPTLRLNPAPAELSVAPGRVARDIHIDAAMCESALKYAVPLIAGVPSAEGRFSLELDACRIPWDDPGLGQLSGRLTIHSAQIGPGPLIHDLMPLLHVTGPAHLQEESVIAFQVHDRRVYHQGTELVFPDLKLRTKGSVGLDQTLSMTAEFTPLPGRLLAGLPVAAALANQATSVPISVPIGGTLTHPSVDARALVDMNLNRQNLKKAAGSLLPLNLRDLLPPR